MIVCHRWTVRLADIIKGAFLGADVREIGKPCMSPGGVPGVEAGSLVQVLGNIYGANDAPNEWYCGFDKRWP